MIHEFNQPIPVVTPLGDGYAIYVKANGMWENDEVCVVLTDTGQWRHITTDKIKSWHNGTYDINKPLTTLNQSTNGINPQSQNKEEANKHSTKISEKVI